MNQIILTQSINNRTILTALVAALSAEQRERLLLSLSNILEAIPSSISTLEGEESEELISQVKEDLKSFISTF